MNLTLTIESALLGKARALARQRGVSLQTLIRDYLRTLVGEASGVQTAAELLDLLQRQGGRSGGRPPRRADAYEGRA